MSDSATRLFTLWPVFPSPRPLPFLPSWPWVSYPNQYIPLPHYLGPFESLLHLPCGAPCGASLVMRSTHPVPGQSISRNLHAGRILHSGTGFPPRHSILVSSGEFNILPSICTTLGYISLTLHTLSIVERCYNLIRLAQSILSVRFLHAGDICCSSPESAIHIRLHLNLGEVTHGPQSIFIVGK